MFLIMNPRIYFYVTGSCLSPVRGQHDLLDEKLFAPAVLEANREGYGEFTKKFIEDNAGSSSLFASEDYSFNPDTCSFDFVNIELCDDSEYERLYSSNLNQEFDITKRYYSSKDSEAPAQDSNIGENASPTFVSNIIAQYPCPSIDTGFYYEKKRWNLLVRNIMKHKNTMLVGPTGAGKTDVIIRICKALNIPCRIYDMGSMQDPLTDLLGSHRLENGTSKFDYSKFSQDIQTPGVILLDELSRAPQMANNILFPCLDGRRMLPIEIADASSDRVIKVHPEVTFIATANIGNEYTGTQDIDEALANRFMTLQVDYLPQDIEKNILSIRTGVDEENSTRIVAIANTLRERFKGGSISKTISTRETLGCAELVVDGFSLIDAINFSFCEKFMKTGDNEYDVVKRIIMGF